MKTYLEIPASHADQARALGARFDLSRKQWFCPDGIDLMLFAKWLPKHLAKWSGPIAVKGMRRGKRATTARRRVDKGAVSKD